MPARLSLHAPDRPVRSFDLEEGRAYLLGRGEDCDLVLDHPGISRNHARLTHGEEGWSLADLGSKNGVAVAGEPIAGAVPLGDDAWVSFGGLLAHFEIISSLRQQGEDERRQRRWQTSIQVQTQLDPGDGLESLLQRLLGSVLEVGGAERGFVLLTTSDGGLEMAASRRLTPEDVHTVGFSGSAGAVELALQRGEAVTLSDVSGDALLGSRASVLAGGIRAVVCLPLKAMDRVIGVIYADSREPGAAFTELDLEMLTALASHAALGIAVARIHQEVSSVRRSLPRDEHETGMNLETVWESSLPRYRPEPPAGGEAEDSPSSWTRQLSAGKAAER